LSDCHNFIFVLFKSHVRRKTKHKITYRSYKLFNEINFLLNLQNTCYDQIYHTRAINTAYNCFEKSYMQVINRHAPVKTKYISNIKTPFMNSILRKAINRKRASLRRYQKAKTRQNWEAYRKQRNHCTSLRKKSIKT
jgi:hypothetical protein